LDDERAARLAAEHEFLHDRITRELRTATTRKIAVFLYESPEQKGRLIGAAGTNLAKPWMRQVHCNLSDVDAVLKHELVHVIAAEFGFPLFRVSVNPGLVEGLAEAIERTAYDETLHRLSAQILTLGLGPDVESLFSIGGFMTAQPGVGYTLAGSFCRYLLDNYGIRRFKRLYRSGDFASNYGRTLPQLVGDWKRFLEGIQPTPDELEKAAYLFKRPTIFGKECARVIANLNKKTGEHLREKRYAEALESSGTSLSLTVTPGAVIQHATALFRLGKSPETIRFASDALRDSSMAHTLLPLHLILGDAYWNIGDRDRAGIMYRRLRSLSLNAWLNEACETRIAALTDDHNFTLREYFAGDLSDTLRLQLLQSLPPTKKPGSIAGYLIGRELTIQERWPEALEVLNAVPRMKSGYLEFLRQKRIGIVNFRLDSFQQAKIYFWQSLNYTPNNAAILEIDEWLGRAEWMAGWAPAEAIRGSDHSLSP
ncbi:MAG: hypothetical protein WD295_00575, partial [Bacteroidota bacterium]